MSYSEFVNELKLENRVIAVTRVNSSDEKTDDIFGCVYKALKKVMEGKSLVLKKDSCSCGGFAHNSGLDDEMPAIPEVSEFFFLTGRIRCGRRRGRNSNAALK